VPDLEERVAALEAIVAGLVQPEPEFMAQTRVETLRGMEVLSVRLLHEPTGITIAARDRDEGIVKLRKALADRARREFDLQEAERRRQRKAAREACGDPG
jgi:hypothetical protein